MGVTVEKTWGKYYPGPIGTGVVDPTNKILMFLIKQGLCATYDGSGVGGAGAWSVVGSCDGSAAGIDAVDRWVDDGDLLWGTGAHAWIVLKQPGINATGQGFQVCIDLNWAATNTEYCEIIISYSAGFTGGSTTARPTATDELLLATGAAWGASGAYVSYGINICKTSDGACNRVYISRNGSPYSMWFLDKPKDPVAWWTTPYLAKINLVPVLANMHNASINSIKIEVSGSFYNCMVTTEGVDSGALIELSAFQYPSSGGNWLCTPMGVCVDDVAVTGRVCEIYDWWYIPPTLPDSEYMRGSGDPYDFVIFGDVLQPFDGSVWHN